LLRKKRSKHAALTAFGVLLRSPEAAAQASVAKRLAAFFAFVFLLCFTAMRSKANLGVYLGYA
jgi:hypothetical protein